MEKLLGAEEQKIRITELDDIEAIRSDEKENLKSLFRNLLRSIIDCSDDSFIPGFIELTLFDP